MAVAWSPGPLRALLALGALGTGVAYVLTVLAARRVGAIKASATAFPIPPVALLLGVLVRGESVATVSVGDPEVSAFLTNPAPAFLSGRGGGLPDTIDVPRLHDPVPLGAHSLGVMREDVHELDHLFSATYEELRRLAATVRRHDSSETLNTTALIHETYLKLVGSGRLAPESRLHFKRIAARAMRQVLVEAARRRTALKRGGVVAPVTYDDQLHGDSAVRSEDLLALDAALNDLARAQPRQALMVEYHFFGGLDLTETAALLDVSESTVLRDWRAAKAWLALQVRRSR